MIDIASTTGAKLLSGSPMPIITTLVTRTPLRAAIQSCPMISPTARSRLNPWRPVEQKPHASAHPTCEETQRVPRSSSGMNTVSIPLPVPTSKSHLIVPSAERCSESTPGARTSAVARSFSRNVFARSVIASKSPTPRWWIQRKTWRARNGFSPWAASHSVSRGSVRSRRFVRSVMAERAALSRMDVALRKEIRDLGLGGLARVRAVHGVRVDGLREIRADGALRGLLRIGRAHEVAVLLDRVLAFEHLDHHR